VIRAGSFRTPLGDDDEPTTDLGVPMRATRHPAARSAVDTEVPARRDVIIRPAPVAMVWQGPGASHAAIAVPGVSLGAGDVLVAVELATICPADVEAVSTGAGVTAPLVLGHEQVGRIVAVGPDAATSDGTRLVVGMRVVWSRRIGCGECDACRDDRTSACRNAREYGVDRLRRGWELSGAFASHVLVRAGTAILTVPEIVPAAVLAPLSCATALAAAALEQIEEVVDVDGETVLIWGADLVGLTVAAMVAGGGGHAVVVEPDTTRRSRALDFGAHGVAAGLADLERLIRAGRETDGPARRLARPVAVVGSGVDDLMSVDGCADGRTGAGVQVTSVEAAGDAPAVASLATAASIATARETDGVLAAVAVVVRLRDAPVRGERTERSAGASAGRDSDAVPAWPETASVVTLQRTETRHLTAAVDFASNAWFRYPFAELVAERHPLESVDAALRSAGTGSALRVAIDPGSR
jgi:D-arabinose 1-dehydrogenase-like Zn-dependent alcohol dehydrogenase